MRLLEPSHVSVQIVPSSVIVSIRRDYGVEGAESG